MGLRHPCLNQNGYPKKRWATKKAAQFVARLVGKRWYACPRCNKWHVGGAAPIGNEPNNPRKDTPT